MNRRPSLLYPVLSRFFRAFSVEARFRRRCWDGPGQGMKEVDMSTVVVVQSGDAWAFKQPPCSRAMIQHLERNEGLVTWLQVFRLRFVRG